MGSARWVQVRTPGSDLVGDTTAATLGVSHEFGVGWRASVASSATLVRITLQPNRTGALLYLAGATAWGVAVVAVWIAWAGSTGVDVCAEERCESLLESVDAGSELPDGLLIGPEVFEANPPGE